MYTCGVGHRSTRDSVWFGGSTQMGASSVQVPCKVQGLGGKLLFLEFRASYLYSKHCYRLLILHNTYIVYIHVTL